MKNYLGNVRFEIKRDRFEIDFLGIKRAESLPEYTADEILAEVLHGDGSGAEILASFDNEEEARAEFAAHYANAGRTRATALSIGLAIVGDVFWIERNEYTDDGDFDFGGDVLDYSAEAFRPEVEE